MQSNLVLGVLQSQANQLAVAEASLLRYLELSHFLTIPPSLSITAAVALLTCA